MPSREASATPPITATTSSSSASCWPSPRGVWLVLRSNSADVQRGAVRAGVGVALLADLPGNAGDPAMACLPGGGKVLERELWLVVHRDLRRAPAVRAVAEFLVQALVEPGVVLG
ncbi:MAG: LysR substrate-binding domain-containing protein [Pseudomonas sp.]